MTDMTMEEAKGIAAKIQRVRSLVRAIEAALMQEGAPGVSDREATAEALAALNLVWDGRARRLLEMEGGETYLEGSNLLAGSVSHVSRVMIDGTDPGTVPIMGMPGVLRM